MSDLLSIHPGMIAIRVRYAGEPSIAHRASTIVSEAEHLAGTSDADQKRRLKRDFCVNVAEIEEAIRAR